MYLLFVSFFSSNDHFHRLENTFIVENAARAYGLPDAELFQTVDLFEKRNIPQVTQCIHALGRYVSHFLEAFLQSISVILGPKEEFQGTYTGTKNVRQ